MSPVAALFENKGPDGTGKHATIQTWHVMGEAFDLPSYYKVIDYLGAGAYGVVCAAEDCSQDNRMYAIKKCKKIFQSRTLAKRTLRELRLLRLFEHENIIKIRSILRPLDRHSFAEIYVIFEIMETGKKYRTDTNSCTYSIIIC
jgi:serine/threonine protein kinase